MRGKHPVLKLNWQSEDQQSTTTSTKCHNTMVIAQLKMGITRGRRVRERRRRPCGKWKKRKKNTTSSKAAKVVSPNHSRGANFERCNQ